MDNGNSQPSPTPKPGESFIESFRESLKTPLQQPQSQPKRQIDKKNISFFITAVLALVATITLTTIMISSLISTNNEDEESPAKTIFNYCQNNNMETVSQTISGDSKLESLYCYSEQTEGITNILFMYSDSSLLENEYFNSKYYPFISEDSIKLEDSEGYKKYLSRVSDNPTYFIISDYDSISITGKKEIVQKFLIDLGYPDRNWEPDEDELEEIDSYEEESYEIESDETELDETTSE